MIVLRIPAVLAVANRIKEKIAIIVGLIAALAAGITFAIMVKPALPVPQTALAPCVVILNVITVKIVLLVLLIVAPVRKQAVAMVFVNQILFLRCSGLNQILFRLFIADLVGIQEICLPALTVRLGKIVFHVLKTAQHLIILLILEL